jgi:hypothetical protein
MTTDFDRFGIDHLSISSLRKFTEAPAAWVVTYLHKVRDDAGPAAWRGLAVEAGVDVLLFGGTESVANMNMQTEWDNKAQGLADDAAMKEYDALLPFLTQGMLAYAGKPVPLQRQARITIQIPGVDVPLLGFADWVWAEGFGSDLKTTWRIPSEPNPNHIEQIAAYSKFHGIPFDLVYCSPKRWVRYEVAKQQTDDAWERVVEAAHAVQSFLAHAKDADDALSMVSPNYTSFYLTETMTKAIREAKARINGGK